MKLVFVIFLIWCCDADLPKQVRVGVLVPITPRLNGGFSVGESIRAAVKAAFDDINKDSTILSGLNLTYVIQDSGCNSVKAAGIAADLMHSPASIDAYIGPGCSRACLSAGLLAQYWNKPIISFSCSSSELEDREKYSTFARTQPFSRTYSQITPSLLLTIMLHFQWKRAAILATDDSSTKIWTPVAFELKNVFKENNVTVSYFNVYKLTGDITAQRRQAEIEMVLLETAENARVVFILGSISEVMRHLMVARTLGMLNGDYAFITLDFFVLGDVATSLANQSPSLNWNETLESFEGLITLSVKKPRSDELHNLTKWLNNGLKKIPEYQSHSASSRAAKTAPYLYDAVWLYAHALNRTLTDGKNKSNGTEILRNVITTKPLFTGMSGTVMIDKRGNRVPAFVFENIQSSSNLPFLELNVNGTKVKQYTAKVVWPGGSTRIPDDEPKCLFDPCKEMELDSWRLIVVAVLSPLAVILSLLALYLYRRKKYEKDLFNNAWIIDFSEIIPLSVGNGFASKVAKSFSCVSQNSAQTEWTAGKQATPLVGRYRGDLIAIKRLHKNFVKLSRDILIELKQVRDLVHTNLNPSIGVCVTCPNICIISNYCYRGSLEEILANDNIKLDWFFRASFAQDIAMGMSALHASPLQVHGHLRSSKCLIDSRWVCKVSDYGLHLLKSGQKAEDVGEYTEYQKLFWTAPEFLGEDVDLPFSQPGDVYSYGIILSELLSREMPYFSYNMSPKDIINQVAKQLIPQFRPEYPTDIAGYKGVIRLMQMCWDNDPLMRPTFSEIKSKLKSLNRGKNSNIVDNMIRMMENYTDQLEHLVDERTMQLAHEKAKTDELLYKMLPKSIAEDLKQGRSLTAESFSSVTICFSDIVGFTSMAAQCTPMQVVHFLNDLYTCFDNIIDAHDVYKVETIGDAYMVVSGLPVRNGNKHAGEIATMALHLLSFTRDFKIQNLPNSRLQLRLGIHTGSCVAGVVGHKMPRYCLFGDTVNYASRMESTGLALRIHVSPECKAALDRIGGFYLKERGPVTLKGKGTIISYFLNGKDGFTKPLPDLLDAAPLAEHEFKQ